MTSKATITRWAVRSSLHCLFSIFLLGLPGEAVSQAAAENAPSASGTSDSVVPGLPPVLPRAEGVKDPVFSILVGLVLGDVYGTLTEQRLQTELDRQGTKSRLPYQSLQALTRLPVIPGSTAMVRLAFRGGLNLPIPYSILGYHPGSFKATEHCLFREWTFPSLSLRHEEVKDGQSEQRIITLNDVHLFGLLEGQVKIDIDGWLDLLMGDALDDTDVTCLMLCRYQGKWLGFAMGYSDDGGGRSGAFSFTKDEIMFPTPSELRTVGREMRRRKELLMSSWQEPRKYSVGTEANSPEPPAR